MQRTEQEQRRERIPPVKDGTKQRWDETRVGGLMKQDERNFISLHGAVSMKAVKGAVREFTVWYSRSQEHVLLACHLEVADLGCVPVIM